MSVAPPLQTQYVGHLPLPLTSGMLGNVQELKELSNLGSQDCNPEAICPAIARIFRVRETEVALLELRGGLLNFVYPAELQTAGAIPLSSSAVAARTARTREAELFNSFAQVKHSSVFELVKLGDRGLDEQVIQKLMSVPLLSNGQEVWGVIQVSRKGPNVDLTGPDFTPEDLHRLELVAATVARLMSKARYAFLH